MWLQGGGGGGLVDVLATRWAELELDVERHVGAVLRRLVPSHPSRQQIDQIESAFDTRLSAQATSPDDVFI